MSTSIITTCRKCHLTYADDNIITEDYVKFSYPNDGVQILTKPPKKWCPQCIETFIKKQ